MSESAMESSANEPAMFLPSDGPGLLPKKAHEPLTQACLSCASEVIPEVHVQTQQLHALERHRMSHVSPSRLKKPVKCVGRLPAKSSAVSEECGVWWIEAGSNSFSVFPSRGETIWCYDCSDQEHLAEVTLCSQVWAFGCWQSPLICSGAHPLES